MPTEQATRPDWTTMRPADFDRDAPLALFDLPTGVAARDGIYGGTTQTVRSTGFDLFSLLPTD